MKRSRIMKLKCSLINQCAEFQYIEQMIRAAQKLKFDIHFGKCSKPYIFFQTLIFLYE